MAMAFEFLMEKVAMADDGEMDMKKLEWRDSCFSLRIQHTKGLYFGWNASFWIICQHKREVGSSLGLAWSREFKSRIESGFRGVCPKTPLK